MTTKTLSSFGLGLKRGDVVLSPDQNNWSKAFNWETSRILAGSENFPKLKLHHIGSTSIHGILAKPVLDILGEVSCLQEADQWKERFEELGYMWKGEYGIQGRRYLVLYDEAKTTAFVHIHIFTTDSPEFQSHLLFRDRLNQNAELRKEYEDLKKNLISNGTPRSQYSEGKADLIQKILKGN